MSTPEDQFHHRLQNLENATRRAQTAPTIPVYDPANNDTPQDSIEGQLALGKTDDKFYYYKNNQWRTPAGDVISLAGTNCPFVSSFTQLEYEYPTFPNMNLGAYIDWSLDPTNAASSMSNGSALDYCYVGSPAENDYFAVDWDSEPTVAFKIKQKGLYMGWMSWTLAPNSDIESIPNFWSSLGWNSIGSYTPISNAVGYDHKYHHSGVDLPQYGGTPAGGVYVFDFNHYYPIDFFIPIDNEVKVLMSIGTTIDMSSVPPGDHNCFIYAGVVRLGGTLS